MLDISFVELFLVAVVGLMVIGPKQLPDALRTLGLWLGRMRRSFTAVKSEIEREIGMDDIRRQLHNEAVLEEMKRIEENMRGAGDEIKNTIHGGTTDDNSGHDSGQESDADSGPAAAESDVSIPAANEDSAQSASGNSSSEDSGGEEPNRHSGNA